MNILLTVTTVHSPAVIDVYCAQIVYGRATNIFSVSEHMVSAPDKSKREINFCEIVHTESLQSAGQYTNSDNYNVFHESVTFVKGRKFKKTYFAIVPTWF